MGGDEKQERCCLGGNRVRMNNSKIMIQRCRLHCGVSGCGRQRSSSVINFCLYYFYEHTTTVELCHRLFYV